MGHGIYYIPKLDPLLGEVRPAAEEVIKVIAKKERIRIRPAGAYALHSLGLTTQVPTKLIYLTDGNPKLFRLGKLQVRFKPTSPKRMSIKGKISGLVIQAIEELGTDEISKEIKNKLVEFLKKENPKVLKEDLSLAPIIPFPFGSRPFSIAAVTIINPNNYGNTKEIMGSSRNRIVLQT